MSKTTGTNVRGNEHRVVKAMLARGEEGGKDRSKAKAKPRAGVKRRPKR
tara:strand:+ start:115 stop:261 length:147 start_codon:yes stop_codon:yes gene_type:complete